MGVRLQYYPHTGVILFRGRNLKRPGAFRPRRSRPVYRRVIPNPQTLQNKPRDIKAYLCALCVYFILELHNYRRVTANPQTLRNKQREIKAHLCALCAYFILNSTTTDALHLTRRLYRTSRAM